MTTTAPPAAPAPPRDHARQFWWSALSLVVQVTTSTALLVAGLAE